ncbi:MAG: lamin tail domain-containing protein [Patescibacteria group bacterium]|jgi:DNA/RNA endonuclease YhcR with UshA esterase domain
MTKKIIMTLWLAWGVAIMPGILFAEDCTCPCECPTDPETGPITYSNQIILNEIMPNPSGTDSEFEFIELKNLGSDDVCLTDWQLKDASEKIYKISADDYSDTTIKAGGFFTIYASISNISLNNSGETVSLLQPDNTQLEAVSFTDSAQEDYSYSRDSNNNWSWVTPATPNAENVFPESNQNNSTYELSDDIIINEIYADPVEGEIEFIELKNKGDKKVNLNGWQLSDATDKKFTISAEIEKYYTVYGDETKISLNNDGDTIKLYKPDGTIAQTLEYTGGEKGQSYSYKDQKWYWTNQPTPNNDNKIEDAANEQKYFFSDKIKITELLPDPEGSDTQDEFIEIYNGEDNEMDLFGWNISDLSRTFTFEESIKLKAHEYKAFYITETKISLNNLGEAITLTDPEDKTISQVTYPKSITGFSYSADGTEWAWSSKITPNESNDIVEQTTEEEEATTESEEYPLLSIQEAREQEKDAKVSIEGVVTVLPNILGSQYFYIQDASSGMQIYSSQKLFPDLKVGDLIRVKGKVSEAYNEKRINISLAEDIEIIDQEQDLDMTEAESLDEDLEGKLITTQGQILELTTTRVTLANGVIIYIKSNVEFDKSKYQEGQMIKATGIVSQYKEEYRLLIRSAEDITTEEGATNEESGGIIKAAYAEETGSNMSLNKISDNKNIINYLLIAIAVLTAGIIFLVYKTGIIKEFLTKLANRAAGAEKNTKVINGPNQYHG